MEDLRSNRENIKEAVLGVKIVHMKNIVGYKGDDKVKFLEIKVALPRNIAACKRLLEKESVYPSLGNHYYQSFESNVDFDVRFMVDTKVVGCSWIELPAGEWRLRHKNSFSGLKLDTRCQLEVDVAFDKFIAHQPEGEWSKVAPFRILSFDIECAGRKGVFPEPNHDPVIQIANMVIRQGDPEPFIRNIFTLKTCAPIIGSQVLCFEEEKTLLKVIKMF